MKTKMGDGSNLAVKDVDRMLDEVAGLTAHLLQIKANAAKTVSLEMT